MWKTASFVHQMLTHTLMLNHTSTPSTEPIRHQMLLNHTSIEKQGDADPADHNGAACCSSSCHGMKF
jgi:hypothetical protein